MAHYLVECYSKSTGTMFHNVESTLLAHVNGLAKAETANYLPEEEHDDIEVVSVFVSDAPIEKVAGW